MPGVLTSVLMIRMLIVGYAAGIACWEAESRIWAGIHYRSDIDAGRQLAHGVADKVIERAMRDGSQ